MNAESTVIVATSRAAAPCIVFMGFSFVRFVGLGSMIWPAGADAVTAVACSLATIDQVATSCARQTHLSHRVYSILRIFERCGPTAQILSLSAASGTAVQTAPWNLWQSRGGVYPSLSVSATPAREADRAPAWKAA